jgi:hypothetical protein
MVSKRGNKMNTIRIIKHNHNLEILSKVSDSVAKKYDCGITYNAAERQAVFRGDTKRKASILRETMAIFKWKP